MPRLTKEEAARRKALFPEIQRKYNRGEKDVSRLSEEYDIPLSSLYRLLKIRKVEYQTVISKKPIEPAIPFDADLSNAIANRIMTKYRLELYTWKKYGKTVDEITNMFVDDYLKRKPYLEEISALKKKIDDQRNDIIELMHGYYSARASLLRARN